MLQLFILIIWKVINQARNCNKGGENQHIQSDCIYVQKALMLNICINKKKN